MFFLLSKTLDILLQPIVWMLLLLLGTYLIKTQYRKVYTWLALVLCYLLSNGYVINALFGLWELPSQANQPNYTYAVVLGGGFIKDQGKWSHDIHFGESADRLLQALRWYKTGKIDKIIISGGSPNIGNYLKDFAQESQKSKQFLMEMGVPASHVILETQSLNTHDNAVFTSKLLKQAGFKGKLLMFTSAYHLRRSLACFKAQGWVCDYVATDIKYKSELDLQNRFIPEEENTYRLRQLIREWVGYLVYDLVGYI